MFHNAFLVLGKQHKMRVNIRHKKPKQTFRSNQRRPRSLEDDDVFRDKHDEDFAKRYEATKRCIQYKYEGPIGRDSKTSMKTRASLLSQKIAENEFRLAQQQGF